MLGGITVSRTQYRALGLDLNITIRIPDTQPLATTDRIRRDFLEFVKYTLPKQAAYGTHSFYRHAFETREDKVQFAMPPEIDEEKAATATASWAFVGPTITALEDDIAQVLTSCRDEEQFADRSHEPFAWELPIAVGNSYAGIRHVVEEFATAKGFSASRGSRELRHVVRILLAVTGQGVMSGSPYDVAEAMQHLASAVKHGQPIRVSDFEYALGQLPAERLFPDFPPSVGNIAKALLVADHPLGRSDILERAGISGSTYDRRISELAAFDFVSQTSTEKWTFQLSPWYVKEGDRTHPVLEGVSQGRMQGVLREAIDTEKLTPEEEEALAAPDYARVRDLFSWLRGWMDVLETLTASIDGCREVGMLGDDPDHVQLGEPPPGRNAEQTGLVHLA